MEPFVTAAVALGTVLGTKALEKTGEKIGEALFDKSQQVLTDLKQESPDLITAIEQASNQPLNYSEAILALQSAAQNNPKLRQKLEILAQLGQTDPYIQETKKQWKSQQAVVNQMGDNYGVIAEKIDKNVNIHTVQGDVNI